MRGVSAGHRLHGHPCSPPASGQPAVEAERAADAGRDSEGQATVDAQPPADREDPLERGRRGGGWRWRGHRGFFGGHRQRGRGL